MLAYISASRTIDFLLYGIEEYNAVIIVSAAHRQTREAILQNMNRGVTVYKRSGDLSKTEQDILPRVVTRPEIARIKNLFRQIDEAAFITSPPRQRRERRASENTRGALSSQIRADALKF